MSAFPMFNGNHMEALAQVLGEEVTGSTLTNIFRACGIEDTSGQSTKWRRIYHSLLERQSQDQCGNNIAAFIKAVMSPGRFINANDRFETSRSKLNAILLFDGLELNKEGEFRKVKAARTIREAEERAQVLRKKLSERKVHEEVMKYCSAELLQDNYFHAVFEAAKSLSQRIRDRTGLQSDGAALLDETFSLKKPLLAFNYLQTETERSEHTGFALLLKGCFCAIRNPLAHEPKILWKGEDDAADYLTLISLLHRKLDEAFVVPYPTK
ncbi:MAG: TIGR02391 family protein [Desulfomonile tiedjei]|nr:TIGR02391 family protein [Desulfomonile tiedjei]